MALSERMANKKLSVLIRWRCVAIVILIFGVAPVLLGQGSTSTHVPRRDDQAIAILQKSLIAQTDSQALLAAGSLSSIVVHGDIDVLNPKATWIHGSFLYIDDFSSPSFRYRRETHLDQITHIATSDQTATASLQSRSLMQHSHGARQRKATAEHFPYALITHDLSDSRIELKYAGAITIGGDTGIGIEINEPDIGQHEEAIGRMWMFDQNSYLPMKFVRIVTSNNSPMLRARQVNTYKNFKNLGGILCPVDQTVQINQLEAQRIHLTSVEANAPTSSGDFESVEK